MFRAKGLSYALPKQLPSFVVKLPGISTSVGEGPKFRCVCVDDYYSETLLLDQA